MAKQLNIKILGGGIIGLTTAICVQKHFRNAQITIITDKLSPHTTADGSAGFWTPYLLKQTPMHDIIRWSKLTYDYFYELWQNGYANDAGIAFVYSIILLQENNEQNLPEWLNICHGYHELSKTQLNVFSQQHNRKYIGGYGYTSFICEPSIFLPFLMKQYLKYNGKLIVQHINDINDVEFNENDNRNFNVIVNCCGLDAQNIVPDKNVYPIRGQVMRVYAPWQFHVLFSGTNYIIPNFNSIILGGTSQINDYRLYISNKNRQDIFNGCSEIVPELKKSIIKEEWVGLRPGRDSVRLELDTNSIKTVKCTTSGDDSDKQYLIVIHNYGHGGAGVTLSWGCAIDVTNIIQNEINRYQYKFLQSHL